MSSRWGRRRGAVLVAAFTLFGVLVVGALPAAAATFTVTKTADTNDGTCDADCSLREAIVAANGSAGADVVVLGAGTYALTIGGADEDAGATGDLDITEALTITGTGAATSTIQGTAGDRVLHVLTGASLDVNGVTITGGDLNEPGAAIADGGGIFSEGTLTVSGVTVSGNGVNATGKPARGGGISSLGPISIHDSTITGNTVDAVARGAVGGGLYHEGSATVSNSTFSSNMAIADSGTLGDPPEGARGGAIYSAGTLTFIDGSLTDNTVNDTITVQARAYGGAIYGNADVTVRRATISGNAAMAQEGDGFTSSAMARGGAVVITGEGHELLIDQSLLSANSVSITDDAVDPVRGTAHGGAVYSQQLATLSFVNSTFSANAAENTGGAVYHAGAQASYSNVTVTSNTAAIGGGLGGSAASTAANSIFAGNTAPSGPDCKGAIISDGYNLLGSSFECTIVEDPQTSQIDVDPKLQPLADNGGPTLTHALIDNKSPAAGTGSPATPGTGDGACEIVDQRGTARPGGQRCDIGAFESPFISFDPLMCNGLDATINGTAGNDTLTGTAGDDVIAGGDGDDVINGLGGNDVICGGAGDDQLNGGDGNDQIFADDGNDTALGDAGADTIKGGIGNDTLIGGPGDDTLDGEAGNDTVNGSLGNDTVLGGPGNDILIGEAGNDVLRGSTGDDQIFGGPDNDTMYGDAGADLLRGFTGDDVNYGGAGDDKIQDGPGADILWGGPGKDKMWGGNGDDRLFGEADNDQLHGNRDNDSLNGGDGTDRIWGESGDDRLFGSTKSDFLYGGVGNDFLNGGDGNDRLFGWSGVDELLGGRGRDQLRGQAGNDILNGGPDVDFCSVEPTRKNCEIDIV